MDKRSPDAGQALVEVALLVPCLILGIFMGLQLIIVCHNLVAQQRMTQLMVDSKSADGGTRTPIYSLFHRLWGNVALEKVQVVVRRAVPWRPHHGISTVRSPGTFVSVRLGSRFLPVAGFTPVHIVTASQTYYEPMVLGGRARASE